MLFISPHPEFIIVGVKKEQMQHHPVSGEFLGFTAGIDADFRHGGLPGWAREVGLANPTFRQLWGGLPDGTDFGRYLSKYDTDACAREYGWSAEDKELVENVLRNHPLNGYRFIEVEDPSLTAAPPWPNYDAAQWKQIPILAVEFGADISYCIEYEKQNKNRPAVVAALEELLAKDELVAA